LSRYEPQREKQFPFHRRFRSSKDVVAADSTLNNNHNARGIIGHAESRASECLCDVTDVLLS
jgi:hypothetical protein